MRKGQTVELKPKTIVIDEIEIQTLDTDAMTLQLRVVCSKGTYIRALARDIGAALDSGAHLTALQRTRIGNYTLQQCLKIEDINGWLQANS